MDEPTKVADKEEASPEPTSDMAQAHAAMFPTKGKEAEPVKKETEGDDDDEDEEEGDEPKPKAEPEKKPEEEEELKLDDLKDGDDIAAWKANKEKGIQKLVERTKAKEAAAEKAIQEHEAKTKEAATYLENKDSIDNAIEFIAFIKQSPENFEKGMAEFKARAFGEKFEPEHESEKKLASHLESKIAGLESKLEQATKPLLEESSKAQTKARLDQRADEEHEVVALTIAADCKGFKVSKDDYRKAIAAHPGETGEEAVHRYCRKAIMDHCSEAAVKSAPKKKELVESTGAKSAVAPESSDMVAHYEYLKQSGQVAG